MRDAVICQAVRSPVGKRNGGLSGLHAVDLSASVLAALIERAGIDPAVVDDVYWGCVTQAGEQTFNVARNAALAAGWPESVPGTSIDRQCGSSQQAVAFAAATVASGQADVIVAGGVESMSRVPMGSSIGDGALGEPFSPRFLDRYDGVRPNQGIGAEMIAERWGLTRTQLDEFSLRSHDLAAKAQADGAFDAEIAPVTTADGLVAADEGIRSGGTLEKLATLKTPFKADGVISAGNASQISDGSAALLVTTSEKAARTGPAPARADPHHGRRRRRPGHHAERAHPGDAEGPRPGRPVHRRHRRLRDQRGLRAGPAGLARRDGSRPRAGQPARWRHRPRATRWAAPARAS